VLARSSAATSSATVSVTGGVARGGSGTVTRRAGVGLSISSSGAGVAGATWASMLGTSSATTIGSAGASDGAMTAAVGGDSGSNAHVPPPIVATAAIAIFHSASPVVATATSPPPIATFASTAAHTRRARSGATAARGRVATIAVPRSIGCGACNRSRSFATAALAARNREFDRSSASTNAGAIAVMRSCAVAPGAEPGCTRRRTRCSTTSADGHVGGATHSIATTGASAVASGDNNSGTSHGQGPIRRGQHSAREAISYKSTSRSILPRGSRHQGA